VAVAVVLTAGSGVVMDRWSTATVLKKSFMKSDTRKVLGR
jgi:hypothetical protein